MNVTVAPPAAKGQPWTVTVPANAELSTLGAELERAIAETSGEVTVWAEAVDDTRHHVLNDAGFVGYRDLWQLRRPLPTDPPTLDTRGFVANDLPALLAVNNRAFDWHPEQGNMTHERAQTTMAEPWFDPAGLRLVFDDDRETLAGFCWTKQHHDLDPVLGEIFVIGVDPAYHGRGLGRELTLAGLDWLHQQGANEAMLYVESDNVAANALYARLGFTRWQTNRAYRRGTP